MNRLFRFLFLILTPIPNNAFLRFSFIKELKWKPKTNFETGLKQTFDWYLNNINYYKSLNKKDILNRLGLK